ncbi:MAG: bifunctional oligoribonuclease/PAP phosphatase NrnA [Planctomycetota bacterium]|nr:bifunctional oligoribonuclease/PAP phosphatase NrnA [Planctomycetota bacterium]
MSDYTTTATMERLAERIEAAGHIVVVTHRKPDGDAIGSALALHRGIGSDTRVDIHLVGPVGRSLLELAGATPVTVSDEPPEEDPDLVVLVDTGSWAQVGPLSDWMKRQRAAGRIIGLDHHPVGDDIASERIIDTGAASCTMMIHRLLEAMGRTIDGARGGTGEAIFAGLATDTGWFQHSNADADAYALASDLLQLGVDRIRLHRLLEQNASPGKLLLLGRALASIRWEFDGRCAVMRLTATDFDDAGTGREELEGLVNEPLRVATVEASILMYEEESGVTKISFRSKPPREPDGFFFDVSAASRQLGGGGHVHASGARFDGDLDGAQSAVLRALESTIGDA